MNIPNYRFLVTFDLHQAEQIRYDNIRETFNGLDYNYIATTTWIGTTNKYVSAPEVLDMLMGLRHPTRKTNIFGKEDKVFVSLISLDSSNVAIQNIKL